MSHFAELIDNNIVNRVIVVANELLLDDNGNEIEQKGIDFCKSLLGEDTRWVQASYNASFRKCFPSAGWTYDEDKDAFIPPSPGYPSWIFNEDTWAWEAPITMPTEPLEDGCWYHWVESKQKWVVARPFVLEE